MKEQLLTDIISNDFEINEQSLHKAPFQGEICRVFFGTSKTHGDIVIKTAWKDGVLLPEGIQEIQNNLEGYACIPEKFRPTVLSTIENHTIILPHVGRPLRDLLWLMQDHPTQIDSLIHSFNNEITTLLETTKQEPAFLENQVYLTNIEELGIFFLQSHGFSQQLKDNFSKIIQSAMEQNDGIGAFASMDATQGNILININQQDISLKIIDPKKPRVVSGKSTYIGIPEIDFGMFSTTLHLNGPKLYTSTIEHNLRHIHAQFRKNQKLSSFFFDAGVLFGHILVASFPNTVERVKIYYESLEIPFSKEMQNRVLQEKSIHETIAEQTAQSMIRTYAI